MKELTFVPVGNFLRDWKNVGGSTNDLHRLYADIERLGIQAKPLFGNLRVVRGRIGKRGKRGGVRVAYFYFIEGVTVFLFALYDRRKTKGFTKEELVELNGICEEIRREYLK